MYYSVLYATDNIRTSSPCSVWNALCVVSQLTDVECCLVRLIQFIISSWKYVEQSWFYMPCTNVAMKTTLCRLIDVDFEAVYFEPRRTLTLFRKKKIALIKFVSALLSILVTVDPLIFAILYVCELGTPDVRGRLIFPGSCLAFCFHCSLWLLIVTIWRTLTELAEIKESIVCMRVVTLQSWKIWIVWIGKITPST